MSIKRRVCLIGAVLFAVLIPLAVCANAAPPPVDNNSYNLIEGNLTAWSKQADLGSLSVSSYGNGLTRFICKTEVSPVGSGSISMFLVASYSVPSGFLVAGNSYSFSFYVPTNAEIKPGVSSFNYAADFGTSVVRVGLGTFEDGVFTPFNNVSVDLTKDTVSQYQGRVTSLSFVCPDYSGDIRAMIIFADSRNLSYSYNLNYYFGSGIMLIDNAMKAQVDQYNQIWYGGDPDSYTNPYTTESYDVGAAGDTDSIDSGLDQWEAGLGEFGTPLRVAGVFLNSLFSTGGIVTIGVIVLVILMFGVIFRVFGVT